MFLALIPLVVISVGWFAHDPVSIFASTVLLVGALSELLLFRGNIWKKNWLLWIPFAIVGSILVVVAGLLIFKMVQRQRRPTSSQR